MGEAKISDLVKTVREAKNISLVIQKRDLESSSSPWSLYSLMAHERQFGLFGELYPIENRLKKFSEQNIQPLIIDFASPGDVLREISKKGYKIHGLSVNLADYRTGKEVKSDTKQGLTVLANAEKHSQLGNILFPITWKTIKEWINKQGRKGADLILYHPSAGLIDQFANTDLETLFVEKMMNLLDHQGTLYAQIMSRKNLDQWHKKIDSLSPKKWDLETLDYLAKAIRN